MNKKNIIKRPASKAITWNILFKYFLALGAFVITLLLLLFLSAFVCRLIIWQPDDPLYIFLLKIRDNIILICGIIVLAGLAVITYHFISRLTACLDSIVDAAEQLLSPKSEPVELPKEIKSIQDELNRIREESLKNLAMAREAEQRKNNLIVYLAHDLKTPLTSVIGYLTLMRDEPELSPELRSRYTGIALEKAERLEDLINEFFEITRFNLASMVMETQRISLSRMLEQLCDEFSPILKDKGLSWKTEIDDETEIICDPDKLERVFDNLIRNAVNYSYENSRIYLSMKKLPETAKIVVRNSGKTIPPEKLSRIFDQFFRLDSSRASATGGAGLGLAIAKEITELHGGSISVESENEKIIFTVLLPLS